MFAGNSDVNAQQDSPASAAGAITVASENPTNDDFSSFSNYGADVALIAPGENIQSAWFTSDTASAYLSGTSMASPHVAGAAALYFQKNPSAAPSDLRLGLQCSGTAGLVSGVPDYQETPNLLLYVPPDGMPAVGSCATGGAGMNFSGIHSPPPSGSSMPTLSLFCVLLVSVLVPLRLYL
jgi:subtilisin family serine protease